MATTLVLIPFINQGRHLFLAKTISIHDKSIQMSMVAQTQLMRVFYPMEIDKEQYV
jgi:hypothetical protein